MALDCKACVLKFTAAPKYYIVKVEGLIDCRNAKKAYDSGSEKAAEPLYDGLQGWALHACIPLFE